MKILEGMERGDLKGGGVVVIREMDKEKDGRQVEELEKRCEVGSSSSSSNLSLFTHLMGDPLCRIRHSPAFLMLVAEILEEEEEGSESKIVGIIRGCIKSVTHGKMKHSTPSSKSTTASLVFPLFTKVAYILGLRVSPSYRRIGIATKLVKKMEEWFKDNGAQYSYLATESDNEASISLFNHKCGYSKFRTPSILVQPVFAHRVGLSSRVTILQLTTLHAEAIYRLKFATTEFFPRDIDAVLSNPLSLGTFLAVPRGYSWTGPSKFLSDPPESWAVLSVWNCSDVWKLEVRGASRLIKGLVRVIRAVDQALPFLRIPSFPDVFKPFGLHFLYGLGGEGPNATKMVKALCGFAHNLALDHECSVVATEVSSQEPIRSGIPHWKKLSCDEDLWCIRRLGQDYSGEAVIDWTKSPPGLSIFVDPREF